MLGIISPLNKEHIVLVIIVFKVFAEVLVGVRSVVLEGLHVVEALGWVGHAGLSDWHHDWRLLDHYSAIRRHDFYPYRPLHLLHRSVLPKL